MEGVKVGFRKFGSELVLMATLSVWTACSTLYSSKLLGLDNQDCRRRDPLAFYAYQFEFYMLCICSCIDAIACFKISTMTVVDAIPDGDGGYWRKKALLAYLTTATLTFAVFISYLFVDPQATCPSSATLVHLPLVELLGYILISLWRFHKICYGLILSLLGGVLFTCYKGFGNQDPLQFQLMVAMSLWLFLLCGLHSCLRAKEPSMLQYNNPPEDAKADQIRQSLLV